MKSKSIPDNTINIYDVNRGGSSASMDFCPGSGLVYLSGDWGDPDTGDTSVVPLSKLREVPIMVLRRHFGEACDAVEAHERQSAGVYAR